MKKRSVLLLAVTIGLMLTACGNSKEAAGTTGTAEDAARQESRETESLPVSQEPENLPASQEYVSSDGSYKVILLEGLTQTDMQLAAGFSMMGLEGGSDRTGFSGISLRSSKTNVLGNRDLESLEDFADYMADMALTGSGLTVSWEDAAAPSAEGFERCIAREGVARSGISRGLAYAYYAESEGEYLFVLIAGNNDDVEEAKQIIALEILDKAPLEGGTKDFFNGMTAVLDSLNGVNVLETYKMMEDAGEADDDLKDMLSSQAQQGLSGSWGIENADDLLEMADWLINEGHNQNALEYLSEYVETPEVDRDAFDGKLKEQNLDNETYISLLAAYDAWSAYGDSAIAAWDLSRVGSIMGMGYAAGYCTYEEAMDKILEAAEKSQALFDSWVDFNQSYLYGYSYWAEESLDDSESSAAKRAELVDSLNAQTNGPFSVDWNIELKKEW